MAQVTFIEKGKRCRWCGCRAPRMAINSKGHALATTNLPSAWKRFRAEGWQQARVIQFKDHREITFISPTLACVNGHILEEYLVHPLCASLRHEDIMNGF